MRILGLLAGIGLLLGASIVQAQTKTTTTSGVVVGPVMPLNLGRNYDPQQYDYLSYGDKATNAIQGIDYGIARIIRAEGEYLLLGSQAAINVTEAQRRAIANWNTWVQTLYETQRYAREARAAERGPSLSPAEALRVAQIGKPRRLTPSEMDIITGQLTWPMVLQAAQFAPYRRLVDQVFADRAYRGALNLNEYVEAERTIQFMLALLREQITDFQPVDYMTGRRFLESLAYEARPAVPAAAPAPVAGAVTTLRR